MTELNKPNIYTFNCRSWIGTLGKNTIEVEQPKCPSCGKDIFKEIEYSQVELEIEKYNGEDMVSARGVIIVSNKLNYALIETGIKGYAPLKVIKTKYKYADIDIKEVPDLIYLAILPPPVRNIPIAYDYTSICENCKQYLAKYNEKKYDLMVRKTEKDAINLKVFYDSWEGADIFNFTDHGEAGVTQKFLDVIKNFNCPETIVIQAEWI